MPRSEIPVLPFTIEILRHGQASLDRQISNTIRQAVLDGVLRPGDHLPAIRSLAQHLGVARATVDLAYSTLIDEGYVVAAPGRGSFVSTKLPSAPPFDAPSPASAPAVAPAPKRVSQRCQSYAADLERLKPQSNLPLSVVSVSEAMSPGKDFLGIVAKHFKKSSHLMAYASPMGYEPLRTAVASIAGRLRGARCKPEQVIITTGSQLGFVLALKALCDPGDLIWLEDPCYLHLLAAVRMESLEPVFVPVDNEGIQVRRGIELAPQARVAAVTPSHHSTLGVLTSLKRRQELLRWAQETGGWIIEDDYDSELRYGGNLPIPCLQGMDLSGESVIYVGTFSKMLFPGLRLGYVIVPEQLVGVFAGLRLALGRQGNEVLQAAVAEYITAGLYESRIRKLRQTFEERRELLLDICARELPEWGRIQSGDQGMHVTLVFHDQAIDDVAMSAACRAIGIELQPLSIGYHSAPPVKGLVMGFGFFSPDQILASVHKLGFILRSRFAPHARTSSMALRSALL